MKIVFFGSSHFSLHALEACLTPPFKVVLIVTTPPQKKGRGLIESPTPVQEFAASKAIPFLAPENLKAPELLEQVKDLTPELFVVSSYGKMIPSAWLKVPSRYALNVHPSLLPKYRGAAPINWPIILGDKETGMSIAEVTPALDAGDLFYQTRVPLPADADSKFMTEFLGKLSYDSLLKVLQMLPGELPRTAQNHAVFNYARKLRKEDARVDWSRSAEDIANQVRGLLPWPAVLITFGQDSLQVLKATSKPGGNALSAGQISAVEKNHIEVQTGRGILILERLRPAGKNEMSAGDYARGKRLKPGDSFAQDPNPPSLILTQSPA